MQRPISWLAAWVVTLVLLDSGGGVQARLLRGAGPGRGLTGAPRPGSSGSGTSDSGSGDLEMVAPSRRLLGRDIGAREQMDYRGFPSPRLDVTRAPSGRAGATYYYQDFSTGPPPGRLPMNRPITDAGADPYASAGAYAGPVGPAAPPLYTYGPYGYRGR